MKKILTWLDHNLLTILAGFLIAFIPLYPKIPLAELIQGYIVRLRLEDLLVFFALGVWLIQLIRRKVVFPRNPVSYLILAYLAVGLLSSLSAVFLTETVPMEKAHLLKLILHWVRRVEYFALYFITFSAIRSKKDLVLFLKIATLTLFGVVLYGIGQKYFYFPAFSTMNREFSKGVRLYLQPNTRLFSTFGGHYDLAGYLMMLLMFTLPAAWVATKKYLRWGLYLLSAFAYWSLVLTTSRTSFIGYLVGLTLIAVLLAKYRGFWWTARRYFVTMLISLVIMFSFSDLLERFTQVIPNKDTREKILAIQTIINQPFVSEPAGSQSVAELPSLFAFLFKGETLTPVELSDAEKNTLANVASKSDRPPSPVKPTPTPDPALPTDVTGESEQIRRDAAEAEGKEYTGPSYSANALKYGLSMGIRLDVLWPQAIKGFLTNPLLGSGYATLVKSNVDEFTYAESTDNDYLRMLGETGILGTVTFLAILFFLVKQALANVKESSRELDLISLGALGAVVAMLVTATYIDIFESSKVAYTFWMIAGLVTYLYSRREVQKNEN